MKALETNGLRSHAVEMSFGPFSLLCLPLDDAEAREPPGAHRSLQLTRPAGHQPHGSLKADEGVSGTSLPPAGAEHPDQAPAFHCRRGPLTSVDAAAPAGGERRTREALSDQLASGSGGFAQVRT